MDELQEKATQEQKLSIQARATEPVTEGGGFNFLMLAQTGNLAPPWWSVSRDDYLMRHWPECPLFAGAAYNIAAKLATVPPIIEPRDPTIKSHRDLAEEYERKLYEGSEFGRGWIEFAMKWHMDRWTQDAGGYAEVIGDGRKDGPIRGPALGLANLDASRCTRTGNPEYPVVYTRAGDGKKFKLHHTRVIYGSQMPSTRDDMHGVGFSWFSRCLITAQGLVDDLTYKAEKLGSRPKRAILVGKKMSIDMVTNAFRMADEAGDNASLTRMAVLPVVANPDAADVGIDIVDLASLPDGFDWKEDANVGMYIIALTGGFPVRWLWPATVVGATKADAMIQHMVGAMSGTAHELGTLALLLGGTERGMVHQAGKFLPPSLRLRFDVQDDWIDDIQSGINRVRAERYERNLSDGAVNIRVTREMMLATGEITEAQFREMELEDGRTQDGLPVDALFYGDNPHLKGIDPDDFTEEEVKQRLKEAKRASVQESSPERKEQAREAVAALEWLLEPDEEEEEPGNPPPQEERAPAAGNLPSRSQTPDMSDAEKERQEGKMARDLRKVFDEFEPEAADDLENGEEPDYSRLRQLLTIALLAWLIQSFKDGIEELESRYQVAFDPAESAAAANAWGAAHLPILLDQLIGTTRNIVATIPRQGITATEIRVLLSPAFSRARAELVAITEITKAMTGAFMWYQEQLQILGLKTQAYWETQQDEMVCEHICAPLDGQPKEVWQTEFPDGPPAHGRCRCGLRLEVERR